MIKHYTHLSSVMPLRLVNNTGEPGEGNLCFVNAPMQAFLNLELTRTYFLGHSFSANEKPISAEIKRLFNCTPSTEQSLKELRRMVGESEGKPYTESQEDSHEFLTFLLNSLRREGQNLLVDEFSYGIELTKTHFSSPNKMCKSDHFYSPDSSQKEIDFINLELDGLADSHSLQALINAKYSGMEVTEAKCNQCCQCDKKQN